MTLSTHMNCIASLMMTTPGRSFGEMLSTLASRETFCMPRPTNMMIQTRFVPTLCSVSCFELFGSRGALGISLDVSVVLIHLSYIQFCVISHMLPSCRLAGCLSVLCSKTFQFLTLLATVQLNSFIHAMVMGIWPLPFYSTFSSLDLDWASQGQRKVKSCWVRFLAHFSTYRNKIWRCWSNWNKTPWHLLRKRMS